MVNDKLVINTENSFETQQWIFDGKTKTIKSLADPTKSWSIIDDGKGARSDVQMWKTNSKWF